MAILIPAHCDLLKRPASERIVFDIIKRNLPDTWYVFHSFDYITRDLNQKRWDGEIDFLLYHPQKGFLVLEVKGGTISYSSGIWYQNGIEMDPFGQAKHNKYAVMRLLQEQLQIPIPLKFAHAVCFPDCRNALVWPPEARGLVLLQEKMHQINSFANAILDETPLPVHSAQSLPPEAVLNILTPCFEYGTRLSERISADTKQFFFLTENQCALLNNLTLFKRLQIRGCAGSGKTVMAVKKAQMLAAEGKTVLLLCFNQLLAHHLKKSVKAYPNITAAAFFEYCIEQLKIPAEEVEKYRSEPRLYSEILPGLLKKHIYSTCLCYDAVIVDEGQDFSPSAWEVISMLTVEDGSFYIFYDPDQNIFQQELHLPDFGLPPVTLTCNCRNTRRIFDALTPYRTLEAQSMAELPEGTEVLVYHGNSRRHLTSELFRLTSDEGISVKDIVILGGHAFENSSLADDPRAGRFKIVSPAPGSELAPDEICYYTYMKFKGCEKKVVILLDVDEKIPAGPTGGDCIRP